MSVCVSHREGKHLESRVTQGAIGDRDKARFFMTDKTGPASRSYNRIHDSAVGRWEKPLLQAMAARTPAWIMPDHLTALGVAGAAFTGACYAATVFSPLFLIGASLGLFINWVGDSLDGNLARYRGIERPRYGFFVDHTSDIFSQMVVSFGLGLSIYMRFDVACLVLIAYLMVSVYTYIRMQATRVMQISYAGFGPTELRILMLGMHVVAYTVGPKQYQVPMIGPLSIFDMGALLLFVIGVVSVFVGAISTAKQIANEDQPPVPAPGE